MRLDSNHPSDVIISPHMLLNLIWHLDLLVFRPPYKGESLHRTVRNTYTASDAYIYINFGYFIDLHRVHGANILTVTAGIALLLLDLWDKRRRNHCFGFQLVETYEQGTAIITAIAYETIYVNGVNQAIRICLVQQLQSLIQSELAAQTMIHTPSGGIPCVKACLQHVFTMISGVNEPM